MADDLEPVPQPLDRGPGGEYRSLERVLRRRVGRDRCGRCEESVRRRLEGAACIHEDEATGPVGRFRVPGRKAAVPEEGRLLVARDSRYRHLRTEKISLAEQAARGNDLR